MTTASLLPKGLSVLFYLLLSAQNVTPLGLTQIMAGSLPELVTSMSSSRFQGTRPIYENHCISTH